MPPPELLATQLLLLHHLVLLLRLELALPPPLPLARLLDLGGMRGLPRRLLLLRRLRVGRPRLGQLRVP